MSKTYSDEAIVIKRLDYGEADRIITLFTKEHGKKTVIAKGVRKLTSKRLSSIEIGTRLKAILIVRSGMDVLGQTSILESYPAIRNDLKGITFLYQLLEIVDLLTREDEELQDVYLLLVKTLTQLNSVENRKGVMLQSCQTLLQILGYVPHREMDEYTLKQFIEQIAEKKLLSKDYLNPSKKQS